MIRSPYSTNKNDELKPIQVQVSQPAWFRIRSLLPDRGDPQAYLAHVLKITLEETQHLEPNGPGNALELITLADRLRRTSVRGASNSADGQPVRRADPPVSSSNSGQSREPSQASGGHKTDKRQVGRKARQGQA